MNPLASELEIKPISRPLWAFVRVPGSKSITNRALLISALAKGKTTIDNALFSDDSRYFIQALQNLGFSIVTMPQNSQVIVQGLGGRIPATRAELFIGNAGTAARFLTAFLTLGCGEYILDGDERMQMRPIGELVTALIQLGATIHDHHSPVFDPCSLCPPIEITASGLKGGSASLAGNISSQYISGLLMVAPYARRPVELTLCTDLNSKPFVDLTIKIMADFGVDIEREGYASFRIRGHKYHSLKKFFVESDATAASYFFAAPAILGGTIRVENITSSSCQGDIAFLDILQKMGCSIFRGVDYIEVTGPQDHMLRGVDVNMADISDTAQTLAAIAPFASTPTRISGIASARLKETDRVKAMCTELSRLGVEVTEYHDGLRINPCQTIKRRCVQTYSDHRMAMAFALIGLRVPGITIENPDCVSKTFPGYFNVLESLR
jgi:3-phosphoshikimate 1-carboxyvinyltransferase